MDYSKVKYVKPSVDGVVFTTGTVYLTKDKIYEIQQVISDEFGLCCLINNTGRKNFILIPECAHLDGAHWIPCTKDGTPL